MPDNYSVRDLADCLPSLTSFHDFAKYERNSSNNSVAKWFWALFSKRVCSIRPSSSSCKFWKDLINVRGVLFLEEGKATAISDVVKQYNL